MADSREAEARLSRPLRGRAGEVGKASGQPDGLRCAIAILPADNGDPARLTRSLEVARPFGLGDFSDVLLLPRASGRPRDALHQAAQAAHDSGIDWLLTVSAAESLVPDIFAKTAPALRLHDAVWGGAGLAATGKLERITRLAAQDLPTFFHAALGWWIGPAHFVRPQAALDALRTVDSPAWYADYMLHLWRRASAYKTAQSLTLFNGALPLVSEADRRRLIEHLQREPVFMPVSYGRHSLHLPYTGLNPVIEREQARGRFFEHEELRFLADRLPRGLRIVDAGANTGNHTLFFAAIMQAETVIPVEPHPRAVAALRAAVEQNRLANVDLSRLGQAVGAEAGRLAPVHSAGGGLGATRFVADPGGAILVSPLDELVRGRVDFLKIDVEGMEMQVLAGAARLIARDRPFLYVEVLDETVPAFMAWVDGNAYRVEKLFPDKTHCNYLLAPAEHRPGAAAQA